MGFTGSRTLMPVMMVASLWATSMANMDSSPNPPPNQTKGPNKINVGGSENWRFNFSYTEWAFKNSPFYFNDTLVFKYDPPSNIIHPHSVSLLPNLRSFVTCNLTRAKLVGNTTQGGGDGFHFVLNEWRPYYFVCGERAGYHCKEGRMKFVVVPLSRGDL